MRISELTFEQLGKAVICECWECNHVYDVIMPYTIQEIHDSWVIVKDGKDRLTSFCSNDHNFVEVEDEAESFDIDI